MSKPVMNAPVRTPPTAQPDAQHPQEEAVQRAGGGGAPLTGAVQEEPAPEERRKIAEAEAQLDEPQPPGDDG